MRFGVYLDLTLGRIRQAAQRFLEETDMALAPTANKLPLADGDAKIAAGWIPDEVRTVNIEESDGAPTLTNITTLVFSPGTVANLGGGRAHIAGGGDTINLQGRPVAANAPDMGQTLIWTGSTWAPGNVSGGGESDWVYNAQLIGLVDGVNTVFALPAPAIPSSLSVYVESGGSLTAVPFAQASYENVALGVTPVTNGYSEGGFYGSSPSACLVDGDTGGPYWSSGNAVPVITWTFAEAITVVRTGCWSSTVGGFGGLASYRIDSSADGTTWLTIATNLQSGIANVIPTSDPVAYWRLVGLSKYNGWEWSAHEIRLEAALAEVQSVVLDAAPAVGTIPRASFRITPTIDAGSSSGSTTRSGAVAVYLFEHFI